MYNISGKDNKYHVSLSLLLCPPGTPSVLTYPSTLNHLSSFQEKKNKERRVSLLCKYFPFSSNSHLHFGWPKFQAISHQRQILCI